MTILSVNYNDFLGQLHTDYSNDFDATFKISGNGSLTCRNDNVALFNGFLRKYDAYFRQNEVVLNHICLEKVGRGEIDKVNDNKIRVMRLYGAAFQLYLKSCRFLSMQPKADYSDFILVKWEE
ncbi:hypothetical protein HDU89_008632 [Geranomyces variabilis]|nr:hypothetical protein HDU89_008632 [Geranomyces variabilis]